MTSREKRKRQLRMNQIKGGNYGVSDRGESLVQEYEKRKKIRLWVIIIVLLLILLLGAAVFLLYRYHRYTSYELKWEEELPEGSFVGYEHFGENVIKYSHDGASYLDKTGKEVWIDSFEMNNPKAYISGDYACVYDAQGTQIRIYNETGQTGVATTLMPITKAVVAEAGNCAAILEDADAAYINFYKKDGTEQDISIKTRLAGDGYPMDLALSPEGTQLITAFAYLDGAVMKSKVVFYDFSEIGKNVPNRLVGGFEEPFEDAMIARVRFLNSTYSYAVADTGVYFFSSKNISSPELIKEPETGERIESIMNYGDELAVVYSDLETDEEIKERNKAKAEEAKEGDKNQAEADKDADKASGSKDKATDKDKDSDKKTDKSKESGSEGAIIKTDENRLVVYRGDGSQTLNKKFSCDYDHATTDGEYFYFKGADTLTIFNQYGTAKYSGEMSDNAHIITKAQGAGCFIFSGTNYMREYQFK